jgi:peptide/nickel transport system permease protein
MTSIASTAPARRGRRLGGVDRFAIALFAVVCALMLVVPWLAPHNPTARVGEPFLPVGSSGFLLGTDDAGRDMLSRVLFGARTSMVSAVAVVALSALLGTFVGAVAATFGGWFDAVLMRATDLFLALPAVLLAIAVAAALGPSLRNTLVAVAIVWWPAYARIVRNELAAIRARPHLTGAMLTGISRSRLAARHLLPGVLPVVVVTATLDVGLIVATLAGLSFFGLGSPAPAPELGAMTFQGLGLFLSYPSISLVPALAVLLLAVSCNLVGDAVRHSMDL